MLWAVDIVGNGTFLAGGRNEGFVIDKYQAPSGPLDCDAKAIALQV